MVFLQYLPSRVRRRVGSALHNLRELRGSWAELRPVSVSRYTREELRARAQAWGEQRKHHHSGLRAEVRELTLCEVRQETEDALTLVFAQPSDTPLRFHPGQYLQLVLDIDGQEVRRAYSMSSDPEEETLAVTVRRVPGGLMSNAIHDRLRAGDKVRVLGPSGRFGTEPHPEKTRRVILVAGGVGITPLYSVLQALLAREPATTVELFYANRSAQRIIFRDALEALQARYEGKLQVQHILEEPQTGLDAVTGMLDEAILPTVLPLDAQAEYYICGPPPMMEAVCGFLREGGVPLEQLATERFVGQAPSAQGAQGKEYTLTFRRSGKQLQLKDSQTLLEGGLEAGLPMAFSCQMGGCAACRVKVLTGHVEMEEPNCLRPEERDQGYCLACIARPRSAVEIDA